MALRNREGTPVDPVPFLVATTLAFLVSFSYGPVYFLTFGLGLAESIVLTGFAFAGCVYGAYRRFVWNALPELRAELDPGLRIRRMVYAAVALCLLLLLLSIPLLAR
ncbi:hypothetical protein ACFO0N_17585 [Halobium salinum]|uniref:Uncharacterized protein n=1 Tax=Halobium salinum TaxID=1364940 RepID=A0ABD5PG46_9EURY|nr:hypothetical protein [Halobium salinum]